MSDHTPGGEADMLELMKRFRRAYAMADRETLLAVTSPDFEWHQHQAKGAGEMPDGRVLVGVDALIEEIEWRRQHWQDVHYENLEERAASDLLVQTFTVSGREDGRPFHARAVDLYPVRDGRITRKDTFWKQSV